MKHLHGAIVYISGPAGSGPARDQPVILLQQLRVPLRVYMVVSSSAALIIILTVTILFLITVNHKYRSDPEMAHPVLQKHIHILIFQARCEIVEPGFQTCRRPRSGSQDELLLLGLLLSSSSILVSGLDEASLSSWTSELLCSVSSHVHGRALVWVS